MARVRTLSRFLSKPSFLQSSRLRRSQRPIRSLESLESRCVLDSTVVFSELMFHPAGVDESLEWIELHNQMGIDMDLSGWRLDGGVNYSFANGTTIARGGYLVVALDPTALADAGTPGALGPYTGNLSNSGEKIELKNNSNRVMDEIDYKDDYPWPIAADGSGMSLAKRDPDFASEPAESWTTSMQIGGTPGGPNFPDIDLSPVTSTTIGQGATWSYDDSGANLGTTWDDLNYDDSAWDSGRAPLVAGSIGGPSTVAPSSLVGYWDFNDNAEDHGATGANDGTLVGGTYSTNVPAAIGSGKSLSLTGGTSYVSIPANASLNSNVFTLAYWIRDPGQTTGTGNSGSGNIGHNRITSRTSDTFETAVSNNAAGLGNSSIKYYASGWVETAYTTTPQWTHMAYVSNGSTLSIYANGVQIYTAARTVSPSGALNIGARVTGNNEGFVGNMDDVALWNIALSPESIALLADGSATPISVPVPQSIRSSTSTWTLSTVSRDGGAAGNWNSVGLPAPPSTATFTLTPTATTNLVIPSINIAASSLGAQGLVAANNVRYYRTTFTLAAFAKASASIQLAVDNGAQVWLNGTLLATEITYSGDPFVSPYPSINIAEDGAVSVTKFDSSVATFNNWIVGTNEIIVAVRNPNTDSATTAGGLAFRMDVLAVPVTGNTVVDLGPTTHYFRQEFDFNNDPSRTTLQLIPLIDDGAVFYLNGVEVYRQNMPVGAVTSSTLATTEIGFPTTSAPVSISAASLINGHNVLAVEVHQASLGSPDMAMAATLRATVTPVDPRQPVELQFNEVSSALDPFSLELRNTSASSLNLAGYKIQSSDDTTTPYVFGAQSVPSNGLITLNAAMLGFTPIDGDKLFLFRPDGTAVVDALIVKNHLQGRTATDGIRWLTPDVATPGAANHFDFHDEIVINEIMYQPRPVLGTPDTPATYQNTTLVPYNATWKYNRTGAALSSTWYQTNYAVDGATWRSGQGLIAVDTVTFAQPINTTWTPYTSTINPYYFQIAFNFAGAPADSQLVLHHIIDDGAVFYLNGQELLDVNNGSTRFNMPAGAFNASTFAGDVNNAVASGDIVLDPADLVIGENILSVEVHQNNAGSGDIVFGAELVLRQQLTPFIPGEPFHDSEQQWVELYNRSNVAVDLSDWELGGADYEFPAGTTIAAGQYIVVARDVAALAADYPGITIMGPFGGELSRTGEALELRDALDNPADTVHYYDAGHWHEFADGGGSSLELRDPDADNSQAQAWEASDESGDTAWQTVTYRGVASPSSVGPDGQWQEFLLGMLDAGEVLLDDIRVVQNPSSATPIDLIQNGTFQNDTVGALPATWRLLGTHGSHGLSVVKQDPTDPSNLVLQLVATGAAEHMYNHIETTLKNGAAIATITNGVEYEISYRVKHIAGDRQINTRLYFDRLAKTTIVDAPLLGGTPGTVNSRYDVQESGNIGPTYEDLHHGPTVPGPGEATAISVVASDPDGVASMALWYSVNSGAWQSTPMSLVGDRYTGSVPGQLAGAVVQFYVEGTDGLGLTSTFPEAGRNSRALYQVEDNRAHLGGPNDVHNFRIIMTPADQNLLFASTNALSNDRIGTTIIYDEGEVFYDAGIRLKGSERGRRQDVRISFNVEFQPDHLFRGVQDNVAIDRSGAGDQYSQKEIVVEQIVNRAGNIPGQNDDLVYAITPRSTHTGAAMLMMSRYGNEFLDNQFEDGGDGTLFEYELIYYPSSTTDGNPESPKLPYPNADGVVGVNITNLGDDKERYRWPFLIKNNREKDDYSELIDMAKVFALSGSAYADQIGDVIDVDEFLRAHAVGSLTGIGDSYFSGAQHNLELYVRPEDGKVLLFPHDMDFSFSSATNAALIQNNDLSKLVAIPGNGHTFYGHVYDIVQTSFNTTYMTPWINHFDALLPAESLASFISYIGSRASSALSQINSAIPQVPFAITTNGGANFQVGAPTVTLQGTGWVDVRTIRLNGSEEDLPVAWVTNNTWQVTVPVNFGDNPLSLTAYDFQGNPVVNGTDTITVNSTVSERPLQDFLRVTELMYHPADPSAAELNAGFGDADDFEFVEFRNTSTTETLNLAGVHFNAGITFDFTDSAITSLAPGEFAVIARNSAALAERYGAGLPIAGEYGGRLDNAGETLAILDSDEAIVQSFTYDDVGVGWHPSTDGEGYSLVIINQDAAAATWNDGPSWRPSNSIGGTPGADDNQLDGDIDGNQRVDLSDLAILQSYLGTVSGATRAQGDLDGDGAVSRADAARLARNFGRSLPAASPAAPASIVAGVRETTLRAAPAASELVARRRVRAAATDQAIADLASTDLEITDAQITELKITDALGSDPGTGSALPLRATRARATSSVRTAIR
jgi:hypothetical protein